MRTGPGVSEKKGGGEERGGNAQWALLLQFGPARSPRKSSPPEASTHGAFPRNGIAAVVVSPNSEPTRCLSSCRFCCTCCQTFPYFDTIP